MYGSQYGDFSKHSNWKVMFGCVTQGKAREFRMYELQQSLEDFVARFLSDARDSCLRVCYSKQEKTTRIAIIVHV